MSRVASLATILFTDIVSSTERAAKLGDRGWRELLERHHARVRPPATYQAHYSVPSSRARFSRHRR